MDQQRLQECQKGALFNVLRRRRRNLRAMHAAVEHGLLLQIGNKQRVGISCNIFVECRQTFAVSGPVGDARK